MVKDSFRIGGISYGEKGPHLKKLFWGPILIVKLSTYFKLKLQQRDSELLLL